MDSMRSLNTSLPTPYTSRPVPPEQLLQAFKSAALSVTNLYKSAVQDQNNNRAAGYQDALDDLLKFLDSENLGLQDGDGWRIRRWATERYDGTANQPSEESEDEIKDAEANQRRESNATSIAQEPLPAQAETMQDHAETPQRTECQAASAVAESSSSFKFSYPSETSSMVTECGLGIQTQPPTTSPMSEPEHLPAPPVHLINRGTRGHRGHPLRQSTRAANRNLSSTSGTKRKNPWPDVNFFDLSNTGPKDGPGQDPGNKRGRFA